MTTRRGEQASDDDEEEERATATTSEHWGFFGLVLVQRLCIGFFFFFDKHSIGICFAFALYRLYWGLVFSAFSASDVIMGTGV